MPKSKVLDTATITVVIFMALYLVAQMLRASWIEGQWWGGLLIALPLALMGAAVTLWITRRV